MNIIYIFSVGEFVPEEEFSAHYHAKMKSSVWNKMFEYGFMTTQIQVFPIDSEFYGIEGQKIYLQSPIAICAVNSEEKEAIKRLDQQIEKISSIKINILNLNVSMPINQFILDRYGKLKTIKLTDGRSINIGNLED